MKKGIVITAILVLAVILTACTANTAEPSDDAEHPVDIESVRQHFPPDYSRAESMEITFNRTGQRVVVGRTDDAMMWNRDEMNFLHDAYDGAGNPHPNFRNLNFPNPNEYLFDALIEELFKDREYTWSPHRYIPGTAPGFSIIIFDGEGAQIMAFDLFHWNFVRFNGTFFSLPPFTGEAVIDWIPFYVARILSNRLD